MKIVTVRRISQIFFMIIFLWFCIVTTLGEQWWQLRGWPVNWLLQLDPLVGLGTLLATRTLYAGLVWGWVSIALTLLLGRFFCGWVCPFGALHQFVAFLANRKKTASHKMRVNAYQRGQIVKYWLLTFLLSAVTGELIAWLIGLPRSDPRFFVILALVLAIALILAKMLKESSESKDIMLALISGLGIWTVLSLLFKDTGILAASLQTGLLDPIPLFHRSVNLVILPLADGAMHKLSASTRYYEGAWLIGTLFLTALFLNFHTPRFYCRFICPLGALFGVLSRFAIWRIAKSGESCTDCHLCERHCEGACQPSAQIRISECVLCMNCLDDCHHNLMGYRTRPSENGELPGPDMSRRQFMVSTLSGVASVPMLRLSGTVGPNWHPGIIRPPGALAEAEFLSRCIKCGQCMRICPTNVIHPADFSGSLEGLWTPVLNFRIGTSGCQLNCIACGNMCPTAAIRPISLDERLGSRQYAEFGPIRTGTAFVDRGRCLPWAMDRPCIVCQENCPVSPKAIFTRASFRAVRMEKPLQVKTADVRHIELDADLLTPDRFSTGDYYCRTEGQPKSALRKITGNTASDLSLAESPPWEMLPEPGTAIEIHIRLQQPFVDPARCVGCGVCEHECPVKGKRAIRVTAENETRTREHALLL